MVQNDPYSEALKEAYATAPIDDVLLDTLEIYHPLFRDDNGNPTSIRVVRDYQDLQAFIEDSDDLPNAGELVTFLRYAFEIQLPDSGEGASKELTITIDNVSHLISEQLDLTKGSSTPIIIIWRPYLLSDLSQPQVNPPYRFVLRSVSINERKVTGKATFAVDLTNKGFPNKLYKAEDFPGLVS